MKVLVAIDDDVLWESVLAALRWCVRVRDGDHVTVLHVESPSPWFPHSTESYPGLAELTRTSLARAEQLLSTASRRLAAWDIAVEPILVVDDAAKAILRLAEERQADLIIVGARGSKERGFLIGSVSQKVKALCRHGRPGGQTASPPRQTPGAPGRGRLA